MFIDNLMLVLRKGATIRTYPTADRNASLGRLAAQSLPYLFSWTGYALPPLSVFIHVKWILNQWGTIKTMPQVVPINIQLQYKILKSIFASVWVQWWFAIGAIPLIVGIPCYKEITVLIDCY